MSTHMITLIFHYHRFARIFFILRGQRFHSIENTETALSRLLPLGCLYLCTGLVFPKISAPLVTNPVPWTEGRGTEGTCQSRVRILKQPRTVAERPIRTHAMWTRTDASAKCSAKRTLRPRSNKLVSKNSGLLET